MEQSKKPSGSAFKQQRLKAWQPLLTPKTVLPTFFLIGIVFIPLGIAIYLASNSVTEIIMDYTNCDSATSEFTTQGDFQWRKYDDAQGSHCVLRFNVSAEIPGPVFLYYRLTNFFQNHRRYVKSFNADQLRGSAYPPSQLSDCDPLISGDVSQNGVAPTRPIYPCGLIANSLFNDTFSSITNYETNATFAFSEKGIAWPGDAKRYGKTYYNLTSDGGPLDPNIPLLAVPPPNWVSYNGTYTPETIPDLTTDEHFQVWMRTAGLPNFRKLYGKTSESLLPGHYEITVLNRYPVKDFQGTKSVVISNTSWMGGKNNFLGIAYLVVGSVCIALGIAFLIRHLVAPRKLGDHSYIKWN